MEGGRPVGLSRTWATIGFHYPDEDQMMVMTVRDPLDCIGGKSCCRVCPKGCHSRAPMPLNG